MLQLTSSAPEFQAAPLVQRTVTPKGAVPWDADDELSRLAADLDAVLARRPAAALRAVPPAAVHTPAATSPGQVLSDDDESEFDWVNSDGLVTPSADDNQASVKAAGWLRKAKRQRRTSFVMSMMSWAVAVLVGGAIVGASAYMLLGRLPGLDEVLQLGQRFGI